MGWIVFRVGAVREVEEERESVYDCGRGVFSLIERYIWQRLQEVLVSR